MTYLSHSTVDPVIAEATFGKDLSDASILVVDDEVGMRHFLKKSLSSKCKTVDVAVNTEQASNMLDERRYDIILLDNIMPGQTGLDWLAEQRQIGLRSDIILMTAYADLETAINALRVDASDFILKPFHSNQIVNAISKSLAKAELKRQNSALRQELAASRDIVHHQDSLMGSSPAVVAVRQAIAMAAAVDAHVVVQGETGTGKQIAARMLHASSLRRHRPFAWLPCFGITLDDFRARLFGSLNSLDGEGEGILHNADGGVLFLEDVDLLSPPCQNLLVEWINAGRFQPIGSGRSFQADIRIIGCCNGSLKQAVDEGRFRADLYYLLNVHEIRLPPLRERPNDVIDIAEAFLEMMAGRMGGRVPELSATDKRRLMAHEWPGNIMELRNVVERAIIQGSFDRALQDVPLAETETLATVEQRHILSVLQACGGNRAEAARRLGIARKTIDRKCQAWGL